MTMDKLAYKQGVFEALRDFCRENGEKTADDEAYIPQRILGGLMGGGMGALTGSVGGLASAGPEGAKLMALLHSQARLRSLRAANSRFHELESLGNTIKRRATLGSLLGGIGGSALGAWAPGAAGATVGGIGGLAAGGVLGSLLHMPRAGAILGAGGGGYGGYELMKAGE